MHAAFGLPGPETMNGREPRKLTGATVLQLVPALQEDPTARRALDVAFALKRVGARALVAAPAGPLVDELRRIGGEWIELDTAGINLLKLRRSAERLAHIILAERIDILHAYHPSAAWSAFAASEKLAVWLVGNLPELPPHNNTARALLARTFGGCDRLIAHSSFTAAAMLEQFELRRDRISIIPHPVDLLAFDPAAIAPGRVQALRESWNVAPGQRIVLVPGKLAPPTGHDVLVEAARRLVREGLRAVNFVLIGESSNERGHARRITNAARNKGIERLFAIVERCSDMSAALSAADLVVVPAVKPPVLGRVVAEAQAMARPVVASAIGILPENVLAPPRMADELRTGWLVAPSDAAALADAIGQALALPPADYRALAARARQFAEFAFSPQKVAGAVLAVYAMLLEGAR
jgi:glycosyltransferase involved in cell wall biosynthesis